MKISTVTEFGNAIAAANETQDNRFAVINGVLISLTKTAGTHEENWSRYFIEIHDAETTHNASYAEDLKESYNDKYLLQVVEFDAEEPATAYFMQLIGLALKHELYETLGLKRIED